MSAGGDSETSVQVAVRIRPQNAREQIDMCRVCTFCTPDTPQIVLGKDKAFTYDFVFDTDTSQEQLYTTCVKDLVTGCFDGYNATVLAYGQTGSGKTYTMGSGFDMTVLPEELGVIPRAVQQIFIGVSERKTSALERNEPLPQFEIKAQFLELYNEEIIDLFEEQNRGKLRIHEDSLGNIYVAGVKEIVVSSEEETLACLKRGALSRTVGSTNMNAQSSRSHAIFSLHIVHQRQVKKSSDEEQSSDMNSEPEPSSDWETLKAKFHFVDLAGSERLKRTGATGERAKEGISINCGLLALGNVISALGDKAKKGSHVPYRDSKLTRLLQDSLGGNSKTLMIACISPTDRDFMETLNSLKYSNRARNIKNKVVVNQDKMSQQLSAYRSRIQQLELELQEFKSGRMVVSDDGSIVMNDMANEITMLRTENDKLRLQIKAMQQVIDSQSKRLASLAAEREAAILGHQDESTGQVVANSNHSNHSDQQLTEVIQGYISQIEELKSRLIMSESLAHQNPHSPYRRAPSTIFHDHHAHVGDYSSGTVPFKMETEDLLKVAKDNIEKLKLKGKKELLADESAKLFHGRKKSPILNLHNIDSEDQHFIEGDSSNEDLSDDASDDTEEGMAQVNSSDDSDMDMDETETESLASSVAELSSEINLKQQLVDQLEKSQRNFHTMRAQYEDKMQLLQHQIKNIESERDRVLKEISSQRTIEKRDEKIKEIKSNYERQLSNLKGELKSLKTARKEHAKAMKKNVQQEKELRVLKNELTEMKKQRVKMMNKMRQEANQKKMDDARRAKEVRQLQKEGRLRDHKIKTLQLDAQRRELVLKRRQEELSVLRRERRHNRGHLSTTAVQSAQSSSIHVGAQKASVPEPPAVLSGAVTGTVTETGSGYSATVTFRQQSGTRSSGAFDRNSRKRMSSVFSSDSARKKWREMEKKIYGAVMKRQTMANLAKDMDTWIEKRDQLSRKIEILVKQKDNILQSEIVDPSELAGVDEDLDSASANIDYVQENIIELQNDLIAIDDAKSDGDTLEAHSIIASSTLRESKYLLEHILDMVLNLGVKAAENESETKLLEARLKASEQSAEIMQSLSSPQVLYPPVLNKHTITRAKATTTSTSLSLQSANSASLPVLVFDEDVEGPPDTCDGPVQSKQSPDHKDTTTKLRRRTVLPSEMVLDSSIAGSDPNSHPSNRQRQYTDPPISVANNLDVDDLDDSGTSRRRVGSGSSLESKRKGFKKKTITSSSLELSPSNTPNSCPASPNLVHKPLKSAGSEINVWSRLATTANPTTDTSKGSIQVEKLDPRKAAGKILHCTHTACGHAASVLSLDATQSYLFSASQDRTVKVWNLKTCTELLNLDKHFSYVRCVKFCQKTNLIFTASQSLIKLWDMRHHRARCIKSFGPPAGSGPAAGSESVVQDLLVSPSGDTLFSASGNFINIWDLKKFMHRGRLVGHNGAVCALAARNNLMATGARDRLIKLYDLESFDSTSLINQPSICTLYPPHYDAISSLALYKDLLFSSCGVTIKQWDIKERSLKQAVDGAHSQGNNINSLATFNSPMISLLVSGCKGGLLKMWSPEACSNIGEILAHKNSINAIATNSTCIFTGSSDKTIRIWRPSPQDV